MVVAQHPPQMQKKPWKWKEIEWKGCLQKQKNKLQPPNRWGNQKQTISPLNSEEDDEGDHSDEQEQEDYNAIDVDGLEEDQLDDSDEDEVIWNIKQLHKT